MHVCPCRIQKLACSWISGFLSVTCALVQSLSAACIVARSRLQILTSKEKVDGIRYLLPPVICTPVTYTSNCETRYTAQRFMQMHCASLHTMVWVSVFAVQRFLCAISFSLLLQQMTLTKQRFVVASSDSSSSCPRDVACAVEAVMVSHTQNLSRVHCSPLPGVTLKIVLRCSGYCYIRRVVDVLCLLCRIGFPSVMLAIAWALTTSTH